MRGARRLTSAGNFLVVSIVLLCWFWAFPASAQQGQDAVYNSSGQVTNSPAFIGASMYGSASRPDICAVLYYILKNVVPATGAVIDARGLPNSTPPTSMTCAAGTTPWNNGTTTVSAPSTVLAGGPELR
jgi:hypothetical protein